MFRWMGLQLGSKLGTNLNFPTLGPQTRIKTLLPTMNVWAYAFTGFYAKDSSAHVSSNLVQGSISQIILGEA